VLRDDSANSKTGSPAAFYSGISGLVLPMPKYKFPDDFQQSSRLTYYASLFNSIEINRSFYTLPIGKTIARWSKEVSENFKFTFKLWKQITHAKSLEFDIADVKKFMTAIDNAGDKKGCLLIQFPASIKNDCIDRLQHLLHAVQAHNLNNLWKVAIEFRDNSWYTDDTYNLVDSYDTTIVIHDKSRSATPHVPLNSKITYIRFHGPQGDYRGSYDEAFLQEYACYIHERLAEGNSVFVYFNNTIGDAFNNLKQLNKLLLH
jgi:uncharacterized protein YecE (DUF72 family)